MESRNEAVRKQLVKVAEELLDTSQQPKPHDEAFVKEEDYFAMSSMNK